MSVVPSEAFEVVSWIAVPLGILSAIFVACDIPRRHPQPMFVMNLVWPINALWAGPLGVWMYWQLGRTGARGVASSMAGTRPFWQKVVAGTLHCGAGCTLADLIGPFLFRAFAFAVLGSMVFGEWTLDFILALLVGVSFQYMALAPMLQQSGLPVWWRALKVDFLSLTAWQVGMYGWMALVIFVFFGRLEPRHAPFWFMMQLAMACGFMTSYPMNWWLIKAGIKTAM
jgi:hypothetical protein